MRSHNVQVFDRTVVNSAEKSSVTSGSVNYQVRNRVAVAVEVSLKAGLFVSIVADGCPGKLCAFGIGVFGHVKVCDQLEEEVCTAVNDFHHLGGIHALGLCQVVGGVRHLVPAVTGIDDIPEVAHFLKIFHNQRVVFADHDHEADNLEHGVVVARCHLADACRLYAGLAIGRSGVQNEAGAVIHGPVTHVAAAQFYSGRLVVDFVHRFLIVKEESHDRGFGSTVVVHAAVVGLKRGQIHDAWVEAVCKNPVSLLPVVLGVQGSHAISGQGGGKHTFRFVRYILTRETFGHTHLLVIVVVGTARRGVGANSGYIGSTFHRVDIIAPFGFAFAYDTSGIFDITTLDLCRIVTIVGTSVSRNSADEMVGG